MVSARLLELRSTASAALQSRTIQTKDDRLAILQEQVDRIRTVFAERALDPDMAEIPGSKTGLIVRDFKGKDAVTPVYKVDTGALRHFQSAFR